MANDAAQRFLANVLPVTESGCWLWMGARTQWDGYGQIKQKPRRMLAHRFSWEMKNGPVPNGMYVLHSCDVPACVNPAHLFLGTHADNMRDKAKKGRGFQPRNGGEAHGMSKLTADDVLAIRALHALGVPNKDIAARFGLSQGGASMVISGKRWRHL